MSIRHMSRIWESSKQSGSALLVLLAIADMANDDGVAWPSIATLSRKCRLSEPQTRRLLRKLENDQDIEITIFRGHKSNIYKLPTLSSTRGFENRDLAPTRGNPSVNHQINRELDNYPSSSSSSTDAAADERYKLLLAAGVQKRSIEKILETDINLDDILAELARCYDPRHNIRKPEVILSMNLISGNRPSGQYYSDDTRVRFIPEEILKRADIEYEIIYDDPLQPENSLAEEKPTAGEIDTAVQAAWRLVTDDLRHELPITTSRKLDQIWLYDYSSANCLMTLASSEQNYLDWVRERLSTTIIRMMTGIINQDIRLDFVCIDGYKT
ncbi:MAG: helix-turn-helix domain-containing protein [Candidatus Bathyarchaeota archaeon]|nr:helix-turn-helix domain-containing protein [Candidatus Bathyarchaeota archaeon]